MVHRLENNVITQLQRLKTRDTNCKTAEYSSFLPLTQKIHDIINMETDPNA